MDKVWIVTRWKGKGIFEIQGVFSSEDKAMAACRDSTYGYGPEILDELLPHENIPWIGFKYPFSEK